MSDNEPENYSLEEMMSRLQVRGRQDVEGEPELVTRADGSQALRVRKRKRRSHQPHKEAEKRQRRRMLISVTLMTLFLVFGGLGFLGWFFYLNSKAYQDKITRRIEAWTGAELEMRAFRATPVNAAADYFALRWPDGAMAEKFHLNKPRTDLGITSHLFGVWQGEQLSGSSGELVLRKASEGEAFDLPPGPLPFQMPMRATSLNIRFGKRFTIHNASATMNVAEPSNPEPNVILQNGTCRIPRWGRYRVNYASVRCTGDGAQVGTVQLSPMGEENAEFEVYGADFPVIDGAGGLSELGLRVREMPAFALFGNGLGTMIEGTFESIEEDVTSRCMVDVTDLETLQIDAGVRICAGSTLRFYRLPMFEHLGNLFSSARLVQPRFDPDSTLRVVRSGDQASLKDMNLRSEGLLSIRGELNEQRGGRIGGTLEVGIAESLIVLADTPAAREVFKRPEDGYYWTSVEVGGTIKAPTDSLARQLADADEGVSPAAGGSSSLEDEFESLTTPGPDGAR